MRVIAGTKIRATENYESKKERWLVQTAGDPELSRAGLRTAIAIGLHMNRKQNLLAWPGYGRLAKIVGVDRRTVIRGVKDLEARGHLRVVRSRNGSKNNSNRYHLNIWRADGVVQHLHQGSVKPVTRVVQHMSPEPMNEPTSEPMNIRLEELSTDKEASLSLAQQNSQEAWRGSEVENEKELIARAKKAIAAFDKLPRPQPLGVKAEQAKPLNGVPRETLTYAEAMDAGFNVPLSRFDRH